MNSDGTFKNIFNTKLKRAISVGRPKLRWDGDDDDVVNQDMKTPGVINCKNAALDTNEWTQLLKKAKAHQGLSSR